MSWNCKESEPPKQDFFIILSSVWWSVFTITKHLLYSILLLINVCRSKVFLSLVYLFFFLSVFWSRVREESVVFEEMLRAAADIASRLERSSKALHASFTQQLKTLSESTTRKRMKSIWKLNNYTNCFVSRMTDIFVCVCFCDWDAAICLLNL